MACPWFEPVSEALATDRPKPGRAPLGRLFDGLCHSIPGDPRAPNAAALPEACNFGYGRTTCPQFPTGSEADAVRFTELNGRLIWILEKDYAPLRHGIVTGTAPGGLLARQAEAFRKACLNR